MKYYVYVLMNEYGTMEYVGYSKNLKQRFDLHTKKKPEWGHGNGKFYGRTDITMEVVKDFATKKEAMDYEGELKLQLGFEWTENTGRSKGGLKNIGVNIPERMPLSVYRKDTGEYIGTYASQMEASRKLGIFQSQITNFFKGNIKQTAGYTFKKENKG